MNTQQNDQDMAASMARVVEAAERVEELLKDLPALVQLDALFSAYMKLGQAHGQLEKVGTSLLELGGRIVFGQMLLQSQRPARTTEPAPGQADYPPAPTTRQ